MDMEPGKLFVGGISWDTNEDRLRDYFQTFGVVIEVVIMKDRNTGRARGFGFVVFADPTVAERVVRDKHMIDGRTVEAKKAVPRDDQNVLNRNNGSLQGSPSPARTKKIFVGGLASTVTESDFKNYFDQFGTITDVVVMYDHITQRPRGFGFITYDSEEVVDKVLIKTFHELNGKLVEVKRAVPKELSPGPNRNQLVGYNPGLSRVSSFLNAYTQGYNPNTVGGYGRFSPVTFGRSRFPPFSPSGYGVGLNFDPGLGSNYGGSGSFSSSIGYGRGLNTFHSGSPNRYNSPVGYSVTSAGTGSIFKFDNSEHVGQQDIGTIWGSSNNLGLESMYANGNADNSFGSGVERYRRNSGSGAAPTYAASSDSLDGPFGNFNGGGSFYGDPTWRSSSPELGSGPFGYGLGKVASDVTGKNAVGYVGSYTVTNRANGGGHEIRVQFDFEKTSVASATKRVS
ncbi:RNA-binding (RRM/RBD/RNP motifs) family protein [Actinidia rufa]|uniref:RNA-binding (RRM/RBD/RNP motifs) family protein n=1 Tax=Actinidia rufa TaxID=165716 RepID=A0A7J0EW24_9ERIC|nr:RNA-binding (RRM/RBD/RNP motifs) family protein [Actinidia rufa]